MSLLSCSQEELAGALGLSNISSTAIQLDKVLQKPEQFEQLLQSISVINFVSNFGASRREAFEWFMEEEIPALGHITPQSAIKRHYYSELNDYLQAIKYGGFAKHFFINFVTVQLNEFGTKPNVSKQQIQAPNKRKPADAGTHLCF